MCMLILEKSHISNIIRSKNRGDKCIKHIVYDKMLLKFSHFVHYAV